ncbi:MAG: dienelactone hydrolase [Planctomycetota bacterium]|jgi:dienelactone hydrolase
MNTELLIYSEGDDEFEAFVAYDESTSTARPAVLVSHAWAGQGDFERNKCRELAKLGYVGIALDNYGVGKRGTTKEENAALMTPLVEDRALLLRRMQAGLKAAAGLEQVDSSRLGAMGFCFGGLCTLDLARSGAELRGVVSFHGLLLPSGLPATPIQSKVLVLHGHADPMVPPDQALAFMTEMTVAGADWQVHQYGNTVHAFTNPEANDPGFGTVYDAKADRRSWESMRDFFAEVMD